MKIKKLKGSKFKAESSTKGKFYTVDMAEPSCTCAHFMFRLKRSGGKCKHIIAVEAEYKGGNGKKAKKSQQKSILAYSKILGEVREKREIETVILMGKYGDDEVQELINNGELIEKEGKVRVAE